MANPPRDGTWIRESAPAGPDSSESRELLTDREDECLASNKLRPDPPASRRRSNVESPFGSGRVHPTCGISQFGAALRDALEGLDPFEQLGDRDFQPLGDLLDVPEGDVSLPSLDTAVIGPVESNVGGKTFLGIARFRTEFSHPFSEAFEDVGPLCHAGKMIRPRLRSHGL